VSAAAKSAQGSGRKHDRLGVKRQPSRHPSGLPPAEGSIKWPLILGAWLFLACSPTVNATVLPAAAAIPPGARTNAPALGQRAKPILVPGPVAPTPQARTNAPSSPKPDAAKPSTAKPWSQVADKLRQLPSSQLFFPIIIAFVLGGLLLVKFFQSQSGKRSPGRRPGPFGRQPAPVRSCNVLQIGPQQRQLWRFEASNGGFELSRSLTSLAGEPLPASLITKTWRALWQPKLNIAWLPPEHVFLRVAQFPESNPQETLSMVELQLEKLSPMPVAQIVWSIHVLPREQSQLQTVILMIAARNVVEEFLGQLEGQGYLADRLELPVLDQLRSTRITEDGVWIYPEACGGTHTALVAWWSEGVLQNLDLVTLPSANPEASVRDQLVQMAWAGELEGWLKAPPRWHLVADAPAAAVWEPALRAGLEQSVEQTAPLPPAQLAALTAQRAALAEPGVQLMPPEFSARYKELFYDRLWMRGLLTVGALYAAVVLCYLGAVQFLLFRTRAVENEWGALRNTYTNAIQFKARYLVLKDRQDLKFAALNCYRAVAETMPESLTLDGWSLSEGKRLILNGSAPRDQAKEILDFDEALHKATVEGSLLFDPNKGEHASYQQGPAGLSWRMSLELNRAEVE
jgi:hypothetical protein